MDNLQAALAARYAIEREIGHGGMAVVYRARDLRHDRIVALKVLQPGLSARGGLNPQEARMKISDCMTSDVLLAEADRAMYLAKSSPSGTRMHVSEHCQPEPALLAAETDVDRA